MRNFRASVVGALAALAVALAGLAWAQTTVIVQNLTGNEVMVVEAQTPGGTGFFTTVNALRNATGYTSVATGSTVNTQVPATASKVFSTGAITTWNINLPTAPYDGQLIAVACPGGTATTAVAATLPSGVSIVGTAFTACTSGGVAANTAEYIYSTSANVWYRIQ